MVLLLQSLHKYQRDKLGKVFKNMIINFYIDWEASFFNLCLSLLTHSHTDAPGVKNSPP